MHTHFSQVKHFVWVQESRNKAGVELKKMYLNAVIGLPSLFSLFCVINTQEDDKQKHATFPDVFVHYASIYFIFMWYLN